MFKIGAFSRLVNVSARMLRHYEKCGLIYPAKIDHVKGYRYYSSLQIPLVVRIATLRDMGFSIEEIGDLIENFDDKGFVENALHEKNLAISAIIEAENKKLENLKVMQNQIASGEHNAPCEVILKSVPQYQILSLREVLPDYSFQQNLWGKLFDYVKENNLFSIMQGELIGIYHSAGYSEKNVDVEVSVAVNDLLQSHGAFTFRKTEAIPLAATAIFQGHYRNIASWEGTVFTWIEANHYEMIGPEQCLCMKHVLNETDEENYLTEIQIPMRKPLSRPFQR